LLITDLILAIYVKTVNCKILLQLTVSFLVRFKWMIFRHENRFKGDWATDQSLSNIKLSIVLLYIIQKLGSRLRLRNTWSASITLGRAPHGRFDDLNCGDHLIASSRVKDPILPIKLSHFLTARSMASKSKSESEENIEEKKRWARQNPTLRASPVDWIKPRLAWQLTHVISTTADLNGNDIGP